MNTKKLVKECFEKLSYIGTRYRALLDAGALLIVPVAALILRLGLPGRC